MILKQVISDAQRAPRGLRACKARDSRRASVQLTVSVAGIAHVRGVIPQHQYPHLVVKESQSINMVSLDENQEHKAGDDVFDAGSVDVLDFLAILAHFLLIILFLVIYQIILVLESIINSFFPIMKIIKYSCQIFWKI